MPWRARVEGRRVRPLLLLVLMLLQTPLDTVHACINCLPISAVQQTTMFRASSCCVLL